VERGPVPPGLIRTRRRRPERDPDLPTVARIGVLPAAPAGGQHQ